MSKEEQLLKMGSRIGIICAGDSEVAPFLPLIKKSMISEKAMLQFYKGVIEEIPIVALFSGVCKTNAAIATQVLIDSYGCNAIINAGTSGGMDNAYVIEIADFGIGMSEETVGHIFDKFFQGDKSHSEEGNGLGLSLVKRIVDMSNGSLSVESEVGKGTTISVRLPRM